MLAKFGEPNGPQNFLRTDDSDNLIHWDWLIASSECVFHILGMNFRTEIFRIASEPSAEFNADIFAQSIKSAIPQLGSKLGEARKSLEKWTQVVNPYYRIKSSISGLIAEIDSLELDLNSHEEMKFSSIEDAKASIDNWNEMNKRFAKASGLAFGTRSMLPILGEAFVNLLYFILARSEIKSDKRLFENAIRQQIDIRIKSLPISCLGFHKQIDYGNGFCAAFHTLMNNRNDILHGNISIDKLKFGEVFFRGTVPVFTQYENMWEKSIGVQVEASGLRLIKEEHKVVDDFIGYIKTCIDPRVLKNIEKIFESREFGIRQDNGRIGLLFPDSMADFRCEPKRENH
jgi:hypothetical protein